ncbi:MAG: hypothetical protein B6242_00050 [Anaerolineaceae bacterium 4572_78]|nr:MAG: hypothetical protein B6242_00050 [Anaerolineaceae bacterium 4572_78]
MLKFSECTLVKLDKTFSLNRTYKDKTLRDWIEGKSTISDIERHVLNMYRQALDIQGYDWNEVELRQHFIGPMLALVNFSSPQIGIFSERRFSGIVDGIEMSGEPDSIISSGFREPEKPYFCFQEYKKERDPKGDPAGQALAAMLVAQEINEHRHPIYGCYVQGRDWSFMVLHDKEYCISRPYVAVHDDIVEIFRILKVLKQIIIRLVAIDD